MVPEITHKKKNSKNMKDNRHERHISILAPIPRYIHELYGRRRTFRPTLNPLDTHYPTSAVPQCRGATTATRQQGSTCPVAGRDREKAMSVPRSAHDRRNAERRRVRESLAKKRKKNTRPWVLHGSMKTTLGQALGLSVAFSRTEMPGKGPQRGGPVWRLWPTQGASLKRFGWVERVA